MSGQEDPAHILVVDDDARLRALLQRFLTEQGFRVSTAENAATARAALADMAFDLLVLDVMMPGETGLELTAALRAEGQEVPILMLTARGAPDDRIAGLEQGVDDYLAKPFDPRELVARIESVLRRASPPLAVPVADGGQYRFGEWALDRATRQLLRNDESIMLTSGEFALLCALISHAGQPMKRERLLELTRGDESETFDRAVDVQIHRLRRMIEADPAHPRYLQTVWGVGYVFVPDAINTATPQP